VGALSAYFRGWVDGVFAHLADVALLAPAPLVLVVIGFMLDVQPLEFGLLYGILAGLGTVGVVLPLAAVNMMLVVTGAIFANGLHDVADPRQRK